MESVLSFFTPDHIIESLLAIGFFGSLLPPVNEALARLYSNKYIKAGLTAADRLKEIEKSGGEIDEEQFNSAIRAGYDKVKTISSRGAS